MNVLRYYIRDAKEGIRRNSAAAIAIIFLIFISLIITSVLFILKSGMDDVMVYLQSQAKIKVFVKPTIDIEKLSKDIEQMSFVKKVAIEKKEIALSRLKILFQGKEYLLASFQDSDFPDAITIELHNTKNADFIVTELKKMSGISDVIYAQKFAREIAYWSSIAKQYGVIIFIILISISLLTVMIGMSLSLYQRQKEIRVKLLLGAKESHIRGQFIFEGAILGLIGSILASFVISYLLHFYVDRLQSKFEFLMTYSTPSQDIGLVIVNIIGVVIGIIGSYLSTRSLIRYA